MTFGEVRKAVAIIVGGVPIWGAAASAENGIDQSEWWALAALLSGALLVYLTPNDPPPKWDPPHRPEHLGSVNRAGE